MFLVAPFVRTDAQGWAPRPRDDEGWLARGRLVAEQLAVDGLRLDRESCGTGSGAATFEAARVHGRRGLPFGDGFPCKTVLYQLNLLATPTGIGGAGVRGTVGEVQSRERSYSHANTARVRDDPQVLARLGQIASAAYAAEAATLRVAAAVQAVHEAATADAGEQQALNLAAEVESAAYVVVTEVVLHATGDRFDIVCATTSRANGLDRRWRNARTVSSHNARTLKSRVVGGHLVNSTPPPYAWAIGRTERRHQRQDSGSGTVSGQSAGSAS